MNSQTQSPGNILRKLRLERDWTLQYVADQLYEMCELEERASGINADTVGRWERGTSNPSQRYLKKLDKLFEMPIETLYNEKSHGKTDEVPRINVLSPPQHSSVPENSILDTSRPALASYLRQQQTHMLDALASGSTNLRMRDIVGEGGLFIPPLWEELQLITTSMDVVKYLIDSLIKGQQVLLLGDAGQGKTTLLKQIFTLLVDQFLDQPQNLTPLPFYIPLREFSSLAGNATDVLWKYIGDDFPLSFETFTSLVRSKHIVFLFDGFDEIMGELTQQSINERAMSKLFAHPSILSCRKSFFEFYLSMSTLHEHYSRWVVLQPLALNSAVTQYISLFCQQKQKKAVQKSASNVEKIIQTLQGNQELKDLVQRPLLLVMMLDIFTDPKEMGESEWSVTKLYRKYIEKWLKNEASKPDSLIKWTEKAVLAQEVAWFTYTAKASALSPYGLNQNVTFTRSDISFIVKGIVARYPDLTEAQLLDDLCFRTVLDVSEGESYYFLHKSFQEYLVAKYIFERMRSRDQHQDTVAAIGEVLQEFLPFEVVTFLKEMLDERDGFHYEKDLIANNLIKVYQHYKGDDLRSVTIRQHASHYLARLGTRQAMLFLEQTSKEEPNKWVQRGMMVGLAFYCNRTDILEHYIKIIRDDQEAASINLGYHLVYYGDQGQELGYYDQGGEKCDGTIRALLRRLSNERYTNGRVLDILTLSTLLEQRGLSALAPFKHQLPIVKEFLSSDHQAQNDIFQQEKRRLSEILKGEIVE